MCMLKYLEEIKDGKEDIIIDFTNNEDKFETVKTFMESEGYRFCKCGVETKKELFRKGLNS